MAFVLIEETIGIEHFGIFPQGRAHVNSVNQRDHLSAFGYRVAIQCRRSISIENKNNNNKNLFRHFAGGIDGLNLWEFYLDVECVVPRGTAVARRITSNMKASVYGKLGKSSSVGIR